jgi:hypothetical protein
MTSPTEFLGLSIENSCYTAFVLSYIITGLFLFLDIYSGTVTLSIIVFAILLHRSEGGANYSESLSLVWFFTAALIVVYLVFIRESHFHRKGGRANLTPDEDSEDFWVNILGICQAVSFCYGGWALKLNSEDSRSRTSHPPTDRQPLLM